MAAPLKSPDAHLTLPATSLISAVRVELENFLAAHSARLIAIHPDLRMLADAARVAVLVGGKRLRPSFAYWGWRAVQPAGAEGQLALIRAAASLELLHACALVHDDLMDSSATRRGLPSAHVYFADEHAEHCWPGQSPAFGNAGAVLLGDLLLSWAEEMFTAAVAELPAPRAQEATREFDQMRTEVVAGQFLDVLAQTRGAFDVREALRVIEFKTSKYTIQRPLLIGARAAGADETIVSALSEYGHALGEAFQLRDDLLGVFGDPAETGKPAGDDLRGGKRTLLVALAAAAADPRQYALLRDTIGMAEIDPAGIELMRQILTSTGARHAVEQRIAVRVEQAEKALLRSGISEQSHVALLSLAHAAAHRTS